MAVDRIDVLKKGDMLITIAEWESLKETKLEAVRLKAENDYLRTRLELKIEELSEERELRRKLGMKIIEELL